MLRAVLIRVVISVLLLHLQDMPAAQPQYSQQPTMFCSSGTPASARDRWPSWCVQKLPCVALLVWCVACGFPRACRCWCRCRSRRRLFSCVCGLVVSYLLLLLLQLVLFFVIELCLVFAGVVSVVVVSVVVVVALIFRARGYFRVFWIILAAFIIIY